MQSQTGKGADKKIQRGPIYGMTFYFLNSCLALYTYIDGISNSIVDTKQQSMTTVEVKTSKKCLVSQKKGQCYLHRPVIYQICSYQKSRRKPKNYPNQTATSFISYYYIVYGSSYYSSSTYYIPKNNNNYEIDNSCLLIYKALNLLRLRTISVCPIGSSPPQAK